MCTCVFVPEIKRQSKIWLSWNYHSVSQLGRRITRGLMLCSSFHIKLSVLELAAGKKNTLSAPVSCLPSSISVLNMSLSNTTVPFAFFGMDNRAFPNDTKVLDAEAWRYSWMTVGRSWNLNLKKTIGESQMGIEHATFWWPAVVRASHRSSEGGGFDPLLGLRNRFSEVWAWRKSYGYSEFSCRVVLTT